MGLKVYDPKTKTFVTFTTSSDGNLPLKEMLLLNILIELHVHTAYLSSLTPGIDEPASNIRADIVSVL